MSNEAKIQEMFMLVWVQDDPVEERVARLEELLAEGVDPNATANMFDADYEPFPPLHYAVSPIREYYSAASKSTLSAMPELEIIQALLDAGADPNFGEGAARPFDAAIEWNKSYEERSKKSAQILRMLHEHGGKPDGHVLADFTYADPVIVEALVDFGCDLEAKDEDGNTALLAAIEAESDRAVALFLEHGARLDATNNQGESAVQLAKKMRKHTDEQKALRDRIITMLDEAGAPEKVEVAASPDRLPLDAAAMLAAAADLGLDEDHITGLLDKEPATFQALVADAHDWFGDGDPSSPFDLLQVAAQALGEPTTRTFDGNQSFDKPFFHHGDVEIDGSFYASDAFMITGSLKVKTSICDCGPDSYIVVAGDVHAAGVLTDGEFYVAGDILASQFVYGHYNDNILSASHVRTRLLVADDHEIQAQLEAPHIYEYEDFDSEDPEFRELLVAEAFDDDGVSASKLVEIVSRGGSIFA